MAAGSEAERALGAVGRGAGPRGSPGRAGTGTARRARSRAGPRRASRPGRGGAAVGPRARGCARPGGPAPGRGEGQRPGSFGGREGGDRPGRQRPAVGGASAATVPGVSAWASGLPGSRGRKGPRLGPTFMHRGRGGQPRSGRAPSRLGCVSPPNGGASCAYRPRARPRRNGRSGPWFPLKSARLSVES